MRYSPWWQLDPHRMIRAFQRNHQLHGLVHVPGSLMVIWYFRVLGPACEKRSTTCSCSVDLLMKLRGL